MEVWNPGARRSLTLPGCGPHVFGPYRGVLHTTEGGSLAGALATYARTNNFPHFTVDATTVEQHCPLNVGATALEHRPGTADTNRASAIQIEIVGFAADSPNFPDPLLANLSRLMRWVEAQTGITTFNAPRFLGASATRFNDAQWRAFNGWCGHQHVPNQSHWDPGSLPFSKLISVPTDKVKPMYDPPIVMEPWVASLKDTVTGGVWGLAASGAIYSLEGARDKGGAHGQAYFIGRKAARLELPNEKEAAAGRLYTIIDTVEERYAY